MANDDSKCTGSTCQKKENCYRFTMIAGDRQVWTPFYLSPEFKPETGCDQFWNNKQGEL